jgi:KUP system potassium uptake protein
MQSSETVVIPEGAHAIASARRRFWALTLGCIGVVYGDIGTSPLYALRESVHAATGGAGTATEPVILGILSLIVWALILIVTVKYVLILLRADNDGEGGTLRSWPLPIALSGARAMPSSCSALSVPPYSTATR